MKKKKNKKKIYSLIIKLLNQRFELAIQTNKIEEAYKIAVQDKNSTKWKQIGDLALLHGEIQIAINCFKESDDLSGLLLIYSSLGLKDELRQLGERAEELTRINIAFSAYFLLVSGGRIGAFFCNF